MDDLIELKRYEPDIDCGNAPTMTQYDDGDWIKFDDVFERIATLTAERDFLLAELDNVSDIDGITQDLEQVPNMAMQIENSYRLWKEGRR